MEGYIYILSNSSMLGQVKIGKTARTPDERSIELFTTGVATPFVVEISLKVQDCDASERIIHRVLDRYRVSQRREFFKGLTIKEILNLILPVLGNYEVYSATSSHQVEEVRKKLQIKTEIAEIKKRKVEENERKVLAWADSNFKILYLPLIENLNEVYAFRRSVDLNQPFFDRLKNGYKTPGDIFLKLYSSNIVFRRKIVSQTKDLFFRLRDARTFYYKVRRMLVKNDIKRNIQWVEEKLGVDLYHATRHGSGTSKYFELNLVNESNYVQVKGRTWDDFSMYELGTAFADVCCYINVFDACTLLKKDVDLMNFLRSIRNNPPPEVIYNPAYKLTV